MNESRILLQTSVVKSEPDHIAPDGSEIRLLPNVKGGGLACCTLPSEAVSSAVQHKTVEEIWYFLTGSGQVWRQYGEQETITEVSAGYCVTIPVGCRFQFRNTGVVPLTFLIATMPPWPGASEAIPVNDHWRP